MLAQRLAAFLGRHGIHYGWVIVAVTFLTMLAGAAAQGIPGILMIPLHTEFGWSNGAISGAAGLRVALFGLLGPFAAAVMARYGIRVTVALSMSLIVTGIVLATFMTSLWQLWAFWGGLVGVGTGLTAMVLGASVASRWFTARRGLVVGLLTASSATGSLIFLPFAAWLAEHVGWRAAVLPTAVACAVSGVLMLLLGRQHPSELGLPVYGETAVAAPPRVAGNPARVAIETLAFAARHRDFWLMFGTFFVCGLSTNGLIGTHFIPLCQDFGLAATAAAGVLAMMGAFDLVGTIGSGWLSDRVDCRWLLFAYYGLRGLSLMMLPFSSFSFFGLSLFAVFYGLDWIATVPPTVKLAARAFGRERAGIVFGWVLCGHQLGAAVAAFGGGLSRDALASYLPAFFAAGVACLVAALAALAIGRRTARPVAATAPA